MSKNSTAKLASVQLFWFSHSFKCIWRICKSWLLW